ncbi:MAG: phosphate ABC transporter permease PstA [Actinobacteria bacterium]|nr:phosphate ABC transporter permease PstA [Actinomycetota bacterium]
MKVRARIRRARAYEAIAKVALGICASVSLGIALLFVGYISVRGFGFVNWEFLSQPPRAFMTEGGIFPAIVGTFYLTLGAALLAIPIGVMAGIYLSEYAPRNRTTRIIRLAIANMAGVPSIVYGLFGFAMFVSVFGWGRSILAGAATLACLTLPVIITATEEALRQIPTDLRQASLALGATKLRTIGRIVLPAAAPGIVTGSILGLSRAAGETAPILLTAVAFFAPLAASPMSQTMALPYHLFIMATQATKDAPHMVWGTAFVLVAGVSILNVVVSIWRSNQRRKIRW